MKFIYEADFGWNKKPTITGNKEIWSSANIIARNFDEAYVKAKRECGSYQIRGLQVVSIQRKDVIDIG